MGKRKKRMMKAKYAKKYALKRAALGFDKSEVTSALITIDENGQEENKEESVQVITNKQPEKKVNAAPPWDLEPQLIQIEEPPATQEVQIEEVVAPKPTRRRRATKKSTKTTKTTTTRTTRTRTAKAKD